MDNPDERLLDLAIEEVMQSLPTMNKNDGRAETVFCADNVTERVGSAKAVGGDTECGDAMAAEASKVVLQFPSELCLRREVSRLTSIVHATELTIERTMQQYKKLRDSYAALSRVCAQQQNELRRLQDHVSLLTNTAGSGAPSNVTLSQLRGRTLEMVCIERDQLHVQLAARDEVIAQLGVQLSLAQGLLYPHSPASCFSPGWQMNEKFKLLRWKAKWSVLI